MEIIDDALKNLSLILLFVNATLYIYSYLKRNKSKAVGYFGLYLTLTFVIQILSLLIVEYYDQLNIKQNNLFLSHYYFIFQFIILSLFYSRLFSKKQKKYQIILSSTVFLILSIQYSLHPDFYYKFNLLEIFITSFPLVIYSIIHLYNSLTKSGKFMYINAGILIYLSISTLIFFLGNTIDNQTVKMDKSFITNIWFINRAFYLVYLLLILIECKKNLWKMKN